MRKRFLSVIMVSALILSSPFGYTRSYASEALDDALPADVISEVYETTPVASEVQIPDGVIQEVYETVPAEPAESAPADSPETVPAESSEPASSEPAPAEQTEQTDTVPEGVIQEVYETVPVVTVEAGASEPVEAAPAPQENSAPEGIIQQVMETTPVDQENGSDTEQSEEENSEEATGESSMPEESELNIHPEDVISMVMPVIAEGMYDFTMDPSDLLSRYSIYKEDYEKSSIYFTNAEGEKLHTGASDAAIAKNKSSVPVLLYVTLEIENEYGWPVKYKAVDRVLGDDSCNIGFSLVPVSVDDETGEKTFHKDRQISTDESGRAEMVLLIPGTSDNFDQIGDMYVAREDAVWSSIGFSVAGACNTEADWSEIDDRSADGESIKIHVTYRMDSLTEEQMQEIEDGLEADPETGVIHFSE